MNVKVILDGLESNPQCFHGPCLLFRQEGEKIKEYYACSACRDRKDCPFYLEASDKKVKNVSKWISIREETLRNVLTKNPYKTYHKILKSLESGKESPYVSQNEGKKNVKKGKTSTDSVTKDSKSLGYCYTCEELFEVSDKHGNEQCNVVKNLTAYQLKHPTEIVMPKEDNKTHAQYFFSKETVKNIILLLSKLGSKRILCIGAPRIHEYLVNECKGQFESLLLDIDLKYYNFYNEKQFIWYNMFNNYVLNEGCVRTLEGFLHCDGITILMDPPFGGRVEPLAYTLQALDRMYQNVNKLDGNHPEGNVGVMWIFPYFMERHIKSSLPDFNMLDLKIDYDNHLSFTNVGARKRKFGSPIRIFTNIPLSKLSLDGIDGYKFCTICGYWVSEENRHCDECNSCTSKNGRTYKHCWRCSRCVKPSYQHCERCGICSLPYHPCVKSSKDSNCYHCMKPGHKKRDCPEAEGREMQNKKRRKKKPKRD